MSRVQVYVYADLRQFTGGAAGREIDVEPGQTVATVLDRLGIPRQRAKIAFVNHRAAEPDQALTGGERLDVFSAIGGG
ncbi:MAG: MoaD/ThiS family protein [Candidatus Anammoximicrobium sp.]|nr:MoaD/ThiS family protein [Candidatus Anammoximicrobium sp.]